MNSFCFIWSAVCERINIDCYYFKFRYNDSPSEAELVLNHEKNFDLCFFGMYVGTYIYTSGQTFHHTLVFVSKCLSLDDASSKPAAKSDYDNLVRKNFNLH